MKVLGVRVVVGLIGGFLASLPVLVGGVIVLVLAGSSPAQGTGEFGPVDASGWAWPSEVRQITQGFHDGYSIDLGTPPGGALYAPYAGVVVKVGNDGGTVPGVCLENPSWWRGPNQTVIIRHEVNGRTMYSAHSHVAAGSWTAVGIDVGSVVQAGQQVASEGMSGCTGGPHSHFTLSSTERNSFPDINPCPFLGPPCDMN